ncbi:MAG: hypothetical protein AAGN15_14565, partial [Cyanobacteria bacterium J06581_3]
MAFSPDNQRIVSGSSD